MTPETEQQRRKRIQDQLYERELWRAEQRRLDREAAKKQAEAFARGEPGAVLMAYYQMGGGAPRYTMPDGRVTDCPDELSRAREEVREREL